MKDLMTKKSKTIIWVLISLGVIIVGTLLGVVGGRYLESKTSYRPTLQVVGDVKNVLNINNLENYEQVNFTYKDATYTGVSVEKILEEAVMDTSSSKVFFVGSDGLTAEVDSQTLEETYCLFSKENGWEVINLNHPVSSNIKHMREMIVVSQELGDLAVTLFTKDKNLKSITPGQFYMMPYENRRFFEGKSEIESNYVGIHTSHRILDMQELVKNLEEVNDVKNGTLFLENGKIEQVNLDGYLEVQGNQIHYRSYDKEYEYNDIRGFYLGEPLNYLTDVYYDMEYYIEKDEPVMLIYIDGMSEEIFQKAKKDGIIPAISGGENKQALSVHTSVTNAGFAAMITGVTPDINGIHNRSHRELKVPSIFQLAKDHNTKTAFFEGNANILNTEIMPQLHVNGDHAILKSTEHAIEEGAEFVFIHLHELDELGHTFGPDSPKLYDYLEIVDKKIATIIEKFSGQVIITTDHGMHKTEIGGSHGNMRYEDMVIPIIYQEGGMKNEQK